LEQEIGQNIFSYNGSVKVTQKEMLPIGKKDVERTPKSDTCLSSDNKASRCAKNTLS